MKKPVDAEADKLFDEALVFRDADDYANMRDRLLKVVELDQQHAVPYALLGYAQRQCNELDAALESSRKAVALAPRWHAASRGLFHCLWDMDRTEEAIEEIQRFMKVGTHPDYVEILQELKEKGWMDGPRRDSERHQLLGKAALDRGDVETARMEYEQATIVDPTDPWPHLYLGNLHYGQSAYPEALEEFRQAHRLAPDEAMPLICMADTYHCLGKIGLADQHYKRAVWVEPNDSCAQENLRRWEGIMRDMRDDSDDSSA